MNIIAFDKGERLHSAVAFENFGAFIDTDLASPKNSSGAKLFGENDVIFIGHVLNLVLRLSLLCLLNEVAMCFVSTSLRSWWDFARECFCFGSEDVNGSGKAVGRERWRLRRSPALASRQLRRLCFYQESSFKFASRPGVLPCSV